MRIKAIHAMEELCNPFSLFVFSFVKNVWSILKNPYTLKQIRIN